MNFKFRTNLINNLLIYELSMVFIIYFFSVIFHYIMSMLVPYFGWDEYRYKAIALIIWHFGYPVNLSGDLQIPDMLYPYLIAPSFIMQEYFYFGIKFINALVINTAIFPCYWIARKYLSKNTALFAASLSIFLPFINIGAYALTEVLFFPLFLLFIYLVIKSIDAPFSVLYAIIIGALIAVLLNIRLNAIIFLPAYLVSLIWISIKKGNILNLFKRPYWLIVGFVFFITYIVLQYLLHVQKITDVGMYSQYLNSKMFFNILVTHVSDVLYLIAGHITTLSIPYCLPIAITIAALMSSKKKWLIEESFYNLLVITSVFGLSLFILSIALSIQFSLVEFFLRLHSRYYFYIYPLIIIAGFVFFTQKQVAEKFIHKSVVFIVIIFLIINIYFVKVLNGIQASNWGGLIDNMDIQWYSISKILYWLFIITTLILTIVWYKNKISIFIKLATVFVVIWFCAANYGTLRRANVGLGVNYLNLCGSITENFLKQYPGRFVIVSDRIDRMYSTAFWNTTIPERVIFNTNTLKTPIDNLGISFDYLITNGNIKVNSIYHPRLSIGNCVIYDKFESANKK